MSAGEEEEKKSVDRLDRLRLRMASVERSDKKTAQVTCKTHRKTPKGRRPTKYLKDIVHISSVEEDELCLDGHKEASAAAAIVRRAFTSTHSVKTLGCRCEKCSHSSSSFPQSSTEAKWGRSEGDSFAQRIRRESGCLLQDIRSGIGVEPID